MDRDAGGADRRRQHRRRRGVGDQIGKRGQRADGLVAGLLQACCGRPKDPAARPLEHRPLDPGGAGQDLARAVRGQAAGADHRLVGAKAADEGQRLPVERAALARGVVARANHDPDHRIGGERARDAEAGSDHGERHRRRREPARELPGGRAAVDHQDVARGDQADRVACDPLALAVSSRCRWASEDSTPIAGSAAPP